MFPKHYHRFVAAFTMSVIMVFVMTAVITAVNTGIGGNFIQRWWEAMLVAWPIAFAAILVIGKPVQQFTTKVCSK